MPHRISRREFTGAAVSARQQWPHSVAAATRRRPRSIIQKRDPRQRRGVPAGYRPRHQPLRRRQFAPAERAPLAAALARFHANWAERSSTRHLCTAVRKPCSASSLAQLGIRNALFIATKTDQRPGRRGHIEAQLETSAESPANATRFDLMQVHNLRDWRRALPVVREAAKEAGRAACAMSASRHRATASTKSSSAVMRERATRFCPAQLFTRTTRMRPSRLLPLAADRGIAVIINRAFAGGRLFAAVARSRELPAWSAQNSAVRELGAVLPEVRRQPPGGDRCDPRHDQAPACRRQSAGAMRGRLPDAAERRHGWKRFSTRCRL